MAQRLQAGLDTKDPASEVSSNEKAVCPHLAQADARGDPTGDHENKCGSRADYFQPRPVVLEPLLEALWQFTGDCERSDRCARFTDEADYLFGPQYRVIKGDAHHAADEARCRAAHAFDFFRLPFEFECTCFARTSARRMTHLSKRRCASGASRSAT